MKKILSFFIFFILPYCYAQCNSFSGCNPNTGLYSGNDPEKIEYDNIITVFHASVTKDAFNNYKIWGALADSTGTENVLSPQYINSENYPNLTGNIKKVALGSYFGDIQLIVLTDDGLFVSGFPGTVIPKSIKSTKNFERITVNGKSDGLPLGVNPDNVKMMFATTGSLIITTCLGEVYILTETPIARGNGSTGSDAEWAKVMENPTTPLSDIIVARGQKNMGFALKRDGTLWTWGQNVFSGKSTDSRDEEFQFATKMILPSSITGIKMIQVTAQSSSNYHSYFLLDNKNTLYCLGYNNNGVFGSKTYPVLKTWTTSQYPDGSPTSDISWISANEHDSATPNFAIINNNGTVYTAGENFGYTIGQDIDNGTHYFKIPNGISAADVITTFEVGGHCSAAIKKGALRYGYVGHRIHGSMGDGTADSVFEDTFDFITTPKISVCGASCTVPIIENTSPNCFEDDVTFTIKGTPNDIIIYSLNGEADQTTTIDNTGKFEIKILKATKNQILKIKQFSNLICDEMTNITSEIKIINNSNIQIEEIGNNSINAIVLGGTPKYEYQLLDENGNIVTPWQSSSIFTNLITNYYQIHVKTENTTCTSVYDFIFLKLPNIITPNGDGINDQLNLSFFTKAINSSLDIYDRYGKKMLSLNNKTPYQDYKNFITGTYYYIFTYENGTKKSGWIIVKNR